MNAFRRFKPKRTLDQRDRKIDLKVPAVIAFLTTDFDDVAETFRRDQTCSRALAFDYRINDEGRAMNMSRQRRVIPAVH